MEPLLQNKKQYAYTVKHLDIDHLYKKHRSAFWSPDEIDLVKDVSDWILLNDEEKFFIQHILAFFATSDGMVNENLVQNFYNEVQYPEAKAFYSIQIMMEQIHSETYSLLLQEFVKDESKREVLFHAIEHFPAIKNKAMWLNKWTNPNTASFQERLIAFVAVEGIFFSGSFCAIFWLKRRGLLPGLTFSNELISRDEGLHCNFAINLYNNHIFNKIPKERIKEIFLAALVVEKEFIIEALPVRLIGMNCELMTQYLEFVTDFLLTQLKCDKVFNASNPFDFMDMINLEGKTNFFEKRVSEYQRADTCNIKFRFDEF